LIVPEETQDDIKELVVARLRAIPADREISIGADGSYKRDELIQHVEEGDRVGQKIIEVEMSFLRALKEGALYDD
jgi:hypothetical protein